MRPFFTLCLTLFLVIDPLGNLPAYLPLIGKFPAPKRAFYAIRELLMALVIMILFHYLGQLLLPLLGATPLTVKIAGGIMLFLIAMKLIFGEEDDAHIAWHEAEPFIVPIATPIIAGPSVLAVIMMMAEALPTFRVLGAIVLAWAASALIFLLGKPIFKIMKLRGLLAAQRLIGLIVSIIAVQTLLRGIKGLLG